MVSRKWELFHVGMIRGEWVGLEDGVTMEWSNGIGLVLFAFCKKPSGCELKDFSAGSYFEIAFKDIENIGFFSLKFGKEVWADCPFSPNLLKEKMVFDKTKVEKPYVLHVMLIDSSKGELKLLRSIMLGKEFSGYFREWCLKSLGKNISVTYYNRIVNKVFEDYLDSSELVKSADIKWICPHGEDTETKEERER